MSIRLLHGDCLTIMKDISANSVDLLLCDLPYGILSQNPNKLDASKTKHGHGTPTVTGCPWDVKIDLSKFWAEAKRILRNEHSPVIHFCSTKFGFDLYNSNPEWFRYDLVWDKGRGVTFLKSGYMPLKSHEMIFIFSAKGAFYNRVDIRGDYGQSCRGKGTKPTNVFGVVPTFTKESPTDKRCALSVIKQSSNAKKGNHPTEKPVELYRWLIERYCPPTGTVLDPTFGSGNSVITAHAMGRHAIGIEKDKAFYDKALAKITPTNEIVNP